MNDFQRQWNTFLAEFGESRKMVLSTSLNNHVTSRMMSIIQQDGIFYFQTDKTFRKYYQLSGNKNAALCMDNIQLEGICKEIGHPVEREEFSVLYQKCFPNSFHNYSMLKNERLFEMIPVYVKRWIYRSKRPFQEIFDLQAHEYSMLEYKGE